jgi:hypothetical protein
MGLKEVSDYFDAGFEAIKLLESLAMENNSPTQNRSNKIQRFCS